MEVLSYQKNENQNISHSNKTDSFKNDVNKIFIGKNPNENNNFQSFKNTFGEQKTDPKILDKVYSIMCDLNEIEKSIPVCNNIQKREMLLDRGLSLSQLLQQLIETYNITLYDIKKENGKNITNHFDFDRTGIVYHNQRININKELLNQEYWTSKKIDRYEKTEERKKIPLEFWYHLTDKKFIGELKKCFELHRKGNFMENYNWLFNQKH